MIKRYEEQVYAGVLGKVIGVYMGRPIEGWTKAALEARFGRIDRYVHAELGKPLIVPDDDITGTLTFIRALEDSGRYADTPESFFGDTWLDYLVEGKTVLWWGGMGHSTEHTAYLRLKHDIKAPASGSIALNGKTVAEQIGAQIFIDAFGMVAPGRPALAAELARRAAHVSHDGEAVHAAVVVAGMVSAAFVEKDMDALLDAAVALIPPGCLIARVHRDVRAWARADANWRRTWRRIERRYGYHKYGGNCHVVPNHAVMVLAWAYAPDDFLESQAIVNTAGWDTDCNAANVGAVMGVKLGLEQICARYDFRTPLADRVILPTADGTRAASDCLLEAQHIARIGRRVMGWQQTTPAKRGALHHFQMPGALHGWMAEVGPQEITGVSRLSNVRGHSAAGTRTMRIAFEVGRDRPVRLSTPTLPVAGQSGSYGIMGTSRLSAGQRVVLTGGAGRGTDGCTARLYARVHPAAGDDTAGSVVVSRRVKLASGRPFAIGWTVPTTNGRAVADLGLELSSHAKAQGAVYVDAVRITGTPCIEWPLETLMSRDGSVPGWITLMDISRGRFSDEREDVVHYLKNEGRGICVTGNTDWRNYAFCARFSVHLADNAGLIVRYQGLQRYVAVEKTPETLRLVERHYGETVLADLPCRWNVDVLHAIEVVARGRQICVTVDGQPALQGATRIASGGVGAFFENGIMGWRDVRLGSGPRATPNKSVVVPSPRAGNSTRGRQGTGRNHGMRSAK